MYVIDADLIQQAAHGLWVCDAQRAVTCLFIPTFFNGRSWPVKYVTLTYFTGIIVQILKSHCFASKWLVTGLFKIARILMCDQGSLVGLHSVIFVNENENENGEKRENNEFVNKN